MNIDSILSRPSRPPMTIVTAGTGWGKTTAIAGWARRASRRASGPVAWLTLTAADDCPERFWESVFHAFRGAGVVMSGRIDDLHGRDAHMLLVLDNFHVITDRDVLAELAELASRPTGIQLLLLSRSAPPIPLHRLRLAGMLDEVSANDLAFDDDAVRDLAARAESLDLTPDIANDILERTEGWPVGVHLEIRHLARGVEGPNRLVSGAADASVADYFEADALDRTSPEMRDFLLRTSIVDAISGELTESPRHTPVTADHRSVVSSLPDMLRASRIDAVGSDQPNPLLEPLTARERAVLVQLPTMRTNEEIARDFHVSVNTVKSHLQHLYRKLDVTNRREAVRRARALGLLL